MSAQRPGRLTLVPRMPVSAKDPPDPPEAPKPAPAASAQAKKPRAGLPIVSDDFDDSALSASWPEAVLVLSDDERDRRVRRGLDSVLLDEVDANGRRTRGFVRVVLRVPLGHPKARVYGVFVEVDRAAYVALRTAFANKEAVQVKGKLATRLPFLDDAYGTEVEVREDGSDRRAQVVAAVSTSLREGPQVGPRERRS